MKLVPTDPPGRGLRKARRFAQDMRALCAQCYTSEAIRMAQAVVGVNVRNATVQSVVTRAAKGPIVVLSMESAERLVGEQRTQDCWYLIAMGAVAVVVSLYAPRSVVELARSVG